MRFEAKAVYTHAQEIWQVSACPHDASICATTYPVGKWTQTIHSVLRIASCSNGTGGFRCSSPLSMSFTSPSDRFYHLPSHRVAHSFTRCHCILLQR